MHATALEHISRVTDLLCSGEMEADERSEALKKYKEYLNYMDSVRDDKEKLYDATANVDLLAACLELYLHGDSTAAEQHGFDSLYDVMPNLYRQCAAEFIASAVFPDEAKK